MKAILFTSMICCLSISFAASAASKLNQTDACAQVEYVKFDGQGFEVQLHYVDSTYQNTQIHISTGLKAVNTDDDRILKFAEIAISSGNVLLCHPAKTNQNWDSS